MIEEARKGGVDGDQAVAFKQPCEMLYYKHCKGMVLTPVNPE